MNITLSVSDLQSSPATPSALVAAVAVKRIAASIHDSPGRKSLYSIVDLSPEMTSAVALAVSAEIPGADIYVHPELSDGRLPELMLATESATFYRNMERPSGDGVILFAVPTSKLDVVGATVADIKQISEEALQKDPQAWLTVLPELSGLDARTKSGLENFLMGAAQAGLITDGLPMLANFVLLLEEKFRNHHIAKALDEALPAFRIPPGAGRFKEFATKGPIRSIERWAEQLRELHSKAEDVLYLRNDRGQPLDRDGLDSKISELLNNEVINPDESVILRDLVQDRGLQAGTWSVAQQAACLIRWEVYEQLVKATKAKKKAKLGLATLEFINTHEPSALDSRDKDLLSADISETDIADDEERDFFFRHRELIKNDSKLLKRWEQFVFKKTGDHPNLLAGLLLAAAELVQAAESIPDNPHIAVRLEGAERLSYWKSKNTDICRYIRDRFRGLPDILSEHMTCDFGMLWQNSAAWDVGTGSEKTSITSRQFKFDISLVSMSAVLPDGTVPKDVVKNAFARTQLVWTLPANSFANAFTANMSEVANEEQPLAYLGSGRFARAQGSDKATDGMVDLTDRSSVQDVFLKEDGVLVNMNEDALDQERVFRDGISHLNGEVLPKEDADEIQVAFDSFHLAYTTAVRSFVGKEGRGLASDELYVQSTLYGELLALLRSKAVNDDCKNSLWVPVLKIGVAHSSDKPHVAIACPWHPFRLAEARAKCEQVKHALGDLLRAAGNGADLRTYARQVADRVERTWHPSVMVRNEGTVTRMLVETSSFADFGLLEPPTAGEGAGDSFDGYAKEATEAFLAQAKEYLDLNPHERANFSVVLYNADNRELPSRIADQLARKIESERDLRCDLILTHTNQNRLRQIYAEQNVAISRELDGVLASEAARTFLSRLRVGFVDVDAVGNGTTAKKADMVFLHDVIARGAKTGWRKVREPQTGFPTFQDHTPDAETRRLSHGRGERKSETMLVAAVRPLEVQRYLDLIHELHDPDRSTPEEHFVPVREINFDDDQVKDAILRAHNVGEWVVTFDFIANERLLKNNDIQVIRNIAWPGSIHNVIVSTKAASATLKDRLAHQLSGVIDKAGDAAREFADRIIMEAASVSGRVIMRAARQERNAQELMGLVLSKQVLEASLPAGVVPVAWLQLDDFSTPLGLGHGRRADILVICIGRDSVGPFLDLYVIESKYVGIAGSAEEQKSAVAQTKQSVTELFDRLIGSHDLLNQGMWRSRLADLILEHGNFTRDLDILDPNEWIAGVRTPDARIKLSGVSLVFIHDVVMDKPPAMETSEDGQKQFVFDRNQIGSLLRRFDTGGGQGVAISLPDPVQSGEFGPHGEGDAENMPQQEFSAAVSPPTSPPAPLNSSFVAASPKVPAEDAAELPNYPGSVVEYIQGVPPAADAAGTGEWLEDTKTKLRQALRGYGLDAEIVGDRLTPNAAMIRFKGTDNMTVSAVQKKQEILQTTHSVVVTDVRPGSGEVMVLVRRPERAILRLTDLWKRRELPDGSPIRNGSFLIGERENDGRLLYLNLFGKNGGQPQHGPHTLIAGESGGGKGVLTRNILLDLLATNSPREMRVRFVDPKAGADYLWLRGMPHLDGGIVTDQTAAIETLKELVDEMDRRYAEITKIASNIDKYNEKVEPAARLPRICLFHDEIGDWMADKDHAEYRDAVGSYVVRLASKARAAGVHLFLITQRPDKDALPSQIKANMNNKICLKVSSAINSRIVLDEGGAEQLLGNGHFAAKLSNEIPDGQSSLIIGQAPFIDEDDAWVLADAIKDHWK